MIRTRHVAAASIALVCAIIAGCYSFPYNAQEPSHAHAAPILTNSAGSNPTGTPPAATAPGDVYRTSSTEQAPANPTTGAGLTHEARASVTPGSGLVIVTEAQAREQAAQATEAAGAAVATAATLLPPPWNLLASALAGVGVVIAAQHIRRGRSSGGVK